MTETDGSRRILVVADDQTLAREVQATLIALGYEVPATARTSEEALQLTAEHQPDLVVVELTVNSDHVGLTIATQLRWRFDLRIVFVTASTDPDIIARVATVGHEGYLVRPVSEGQLKSTIELALQRPTPFEDEPITAVKDVPERLLVVGAAQLDPAMIAQWSTRYETLVCPSPLQLIDLLELHGRTVSTVVLVDSHNSVTNAQLTQFVDAMYPWVRVCELGTV